MKGFIEVTDIGKVLISVKDIKTVEEHGSHTLIVLDYTTKRQTINGFLIVQESYSEVVEKINQAIGGNNEPAAHPEQIKTFWEELDLFIDSVSYSDLPKDKRPANYDEEKDEALDHLTEAKDIFKKMGF